MPAKICATLPSCAGCTRLAPQTVAQFPPSRDTWKRNWTRDGSEQICALSLSSRRSAAATSWAPLRRVSSRNGHACLFDGSCGCAIVALSSPAHERFHFAEFGSFPSTKPSATRLARFFSQPQSALCLPARLYFHAPQLRDQSCFAVHGSGLRTAKTVPCLTEAPGHGGDDRFSGCVRCRLGHGAPRKALLWRLWPSAARLPREIFLARRAFRLRGN